MKSLDDLLSKRERNTCYALYNEDLEGAGKPALAILNDMNGDGGKPVTIFATEDDRRDYLAADDLNKCRRYEVESVRSLEPIRPFLTSKIVKCPACGKSAPNSQPDYLLHACPNGCQIYPSRLTTVESGVKDVASGFLVLRSASRGDQVVKFFIDGVNIDINNNYVKMRSAADGIGSVVIDAVPIMKWTGKGKNDFALWITRVKLNIDTVVTTMSHRTLEFTVDTVPTSEKETVSSVFFANLEFMQFYIGFDVYVQRSAFPDLIVRKRDGTKMVIEFEFESRNFDKHEHDARVVDYIICWIDNRQKKDAKVIELKRLIGKKITV